MTDINANEVERRKRRLLAEYDGVTVTEEVVEVPTVANLDENYVGGAYCWTVRTAEQAPTLTESMPVEAAADGTRTLLVIGRGVDWWGAPGGGLEGYHRGEPGSGETYEEAAVREVREETGVDAVVTDCFRAEHHAFDPADSDVRHHALYVCFDADYAGGTIRLQAGELNGAAWFRESPRALHPFVREKARNWFDG